MARDYRTLKLEILAETKQFVDDMKKGEKQVETFGDKATKMGKVAAAAFAAAAAAAAAYAGKLAIEGVQAAIKDAAAQDKLANALRNVTKATDAQIDSVEDQISALSLAFGVADDELRPAFQRLATATGSLSKANDGLSLAMDISAGTGKDLNTVANALGKAYEGNTGALTRLGVGLSTAEIKSLGLDGSMAKLAETFSGAATVQANTLQGQINRLRVSFDETKEAVGEKLLPILTKLLDYFVNTIIPNFIKFKDAAIAPVTDAISKNKDALQTLYNFISKYIIPILVEGFGDALKFIGKIAGGIINVVAGVVNAIQKAVEFAINGINALIKAYNAIPLLPNIPTISAPSFSAPKTSTPSVPDVKPPTIPNFGGGGGGAATGGGGGGGGGSSTTVKDDSDAKKSAKAVAEAFDDLTPKLPGSVADWRAKESGDVINLPGITKDSTFDPARFRAKEEGVTIVVTAPSAIDEEGFKRAVVDALNESANRGTGGGGGLKGTAQVL